MTYLLTGIGCVSQTMLRTFGPAVAFATSRAARTVRTWNRRTWTDGSGRPPEARYQPPIRQRKAGLTGRGARAVTRRYRNRTTPSSTSTARWSRAWACWTTCTATVSRGTTSVAITRSRSCARTATSFSTTWPPPTRDSSSEITTQTPPTKITASLPPSHSNSPLPPTHPHARHVRRPTRSIIL